MAEMMAAAPPATDNPPAPPDNAAPAPPESPDPSPAAAPEAPPTPAPPQKPPPLPVWLLDRANSMHASKPTETEGRVVLMFRHPIISGAVGCEPDAKALREFGATGRGAGMPHKQKAQRALQVLKENGQAAAGPHKGNVRKTQAREAAIGQRIEEVYAQLAAVCEPLVQELVDLAFEQQGMRPDVIPNY